MRYILDTDHVSLLQRGHPQVVVNVARIALANNDCSCFLL